MTTWLIGGLLGALLASGVLIAIRAAPPLRPVRLTDRIAPYLADTPRFIAYIRSTASRYRELAPLLKLVDSVEGTQAATGYAFGRV